MSKGMYRRMGKLTSLICCLCILSQMTGCAGSSPSMVTKNGIYFDTAITITLAADNARAGEEILNGCMELCQKLEGIFSRTLEGSELYQVNHRDSSTVTVSKELAAVIGCGLEYYLPYCGLYQSYGHVRSAGALAGIAVQADSAQTSSDCSGD